MGMYLNPGNFAFKSIRNTTYVDKTGLIEFINGTINTPNRMTCFSRPRRFGKSFAAKMLCAYYSSGCDSHELFGNLEISKSASFETYINKLNVVYIDVTLFISLADGIKSIVPCIQKSVVDELRKAFLDCIPDDASTIMSAVMSVTEKTGAQFFFIIDEWDALFREAKNDDAVQKEYVQLLRGLFKGGPATDRAVAGAYMTGILPIKKYGTQSALTDFKEYTMVDPDVLTRFIGFTEDEVRTLCYEHGADFDKMKQWYDGYSFPDEPSVYNPKSVMDSVHSKKFKSYWTNSETYESLRDYISMNLDGLKDAVVKMLGGESVDVDPISFKNDFVTFHRKDDVLTLLIHLGYLTYDEDEGTVRIPNLEIAREFMTAVSDTDWKEIVGALDRSNRLLKDTIAGDAKAVAESLDLTHEACSSIISYNNENSLACAIHIAYYTAIRHYSIIRELPTGRGFADMVFVPHKDSDRPAMVVELKYDKSADAAIAQIKEKRYAGALSDYAGEILLVGINYDKETKKHDCVIERF